MSWLELQFAKGDVSAGFGRCAAVPNAAEIACGHLDEGGIGVFDAGVIKGLFLAPLAALRFELVAE